MRAQRQDSTTDQLEDVAAHAAELGYPESAAWIRQEGKHPLSVGSFQFLCTLAVEYGCYDAHDWILSRNPSHQGLNLGN